MITPGVGGYLPISLVSSVTGLPAPSALTFSAGEVQLKLNAGAWTNITNTVVPDGVGVEDGQFTYLVSAAEAAAAGIIKLKVNKTGYALYVVTDDVQDLADVEVDTDAIVDGVGDIVINPDGPTGFQTLKEHMVVLGAYAAGGGLGYPQSLVQQLTYNKPGTNTSCIVGTISGGRRTISKADGR